MLTFIYSKCIIYLVKRRIIMAEKKKSQSQSKSSSSSRNHSVWSLNKVSMYTICAAAILYLVSMILSLCGVNFKIVSALQNAATAIMIIIVSILAWRYVSKKQAVWKVLYFVCLLVVIAGIIVPLVK